MLAFWMGGACGVTAAVVPPVPAPDYGGGGGNSSRYIDTVSRGARDDADMLEIFAFLPLVL